MAILTVTLNPALDVSTTVPKLRGGGAKLRCAPPHEDPGGGGVNVSRAIRFLGGDSLALAALAGATGARMHELLTAEGIRTRLIPAPGDTRRSLSVIDESDGEQYRFLMPGPEWSAADVDAAAAAVADELGARDLLIVSGSLPPGAPAELPARLAAGAKAKGAVGLLDTSGPALEAAAAGKVGRGLILRMDHEEAEALAGRALPEIAALGRFAADLRASGAAGTVLAAAGAEGTVLACAEGVFHAAPPRVEVVSKVGAGDSFVGAFAMTLAAGAPGPEALRVGVAAAAAAVTTPDTRLCTAEDVARITPGVVLREI
ncbi:1-phosphofructokinase family hexose kinase [Rhodovulum sp. DZ06]|uniref:1-phosphofructokinase family hexose kinase n=1 Tax=Rhodovulum sp. DZ06 TaxID=3425126 RepID=UPI003D32D79C